MVSMDWSQSGHLGACGKPRLASRSLVQHLSRQASHMKNFTLGGAQVFQFSSQEPEMIAPGRGCHSRTGRCTDHPLASAKPSCLGPLTRQNMHRQNMHARLAGPVAVQHTCSFNRSMHAGPVGRGLADQVRSAPA
jgi:hypothetical protein